MGQKKLNTDDVLLATLEVVDRRTFKALFLRYYPNLCNFAYTYLKCIHLSEEVVQEVFANLWEKKDEICHTDNLKSYLYISVKNKSLDQLKKQKIEREYISKFAQEKEDLINQKELLNGESEFVSEVKLAIDNLPERAKLIYVLSRRDGLTYNEIAKTLDISIKTVESQMVRALKILRKRLLKFLPTIVSVPFFFI